LAKSTREFLQAWGYFVLTPPFVFKYILRTKTTKYRQIVKELQENTRKIIENRRAAIEKEPYNDDLTKDFLGSLLVAKSDEEGRPDIKNMLSDNEIQVLVREMLLGGSDTTANSLAFLLYWLAKKPEIQKKILEEFDQVLGKEGILTYENQSKLTYLDQVINETARLSPASTVIPRRALEADKLGDYEVPAGTSILINLHANNLNPLYWNNPMEFDPDRFSVDNLKKNPNAKNVYFPFGYGAKGCPGQHMARIEMKGVMWVLLRQLEWSLVHPDAPLESTYNIVNQPKNGELFMYANVLQ
jgi:cytochrome P450